MHKMLVMFFLFTIPEIVFITVCAFLGRGCVRKKGSLCMPEQPYSTLRFGTFQDETQITHGSAHRVSWFASNCSILFGNPIGCVHFWKPVRGVFCASWLYTNLVQSPARLTIQHELATAGIATNPVIWMCWGDEDFIGRIARASRKQHANTCPKRTIQISLMTYLRQWKLAFHWDSGRKGVQKDREISMVSVPST